MKDLLPETSKCIINDAEVERTKQVESINKLNNKVSLLIYAIIENSVMSVDLTLQVIIILFIFIFKILNLS